MKKTITILTILLLVVFMVGCENSINPMDSNAQTAGERSLAKKGGNDGGDAKVEICHFKGNGDYITIMVDVNAVQAHLNHGDILTKVTGEWLLEYSGRYHHYKFDEDWGTWYYPNQNQKEIILSNVLSCDGTVSFLIEFMTNGWKLKLTGILLDDTHMTGDWWLLEPNDEEWKSMGDWNAVAL